MSTNPQEYLPGQQPNDPGGPPPYVPQPVRPVDTPQKSPALASFLSALFPGLGQVYIGYYQRGITFGLAVAGIITSLASGMLRGMEPLLGISIGFTYFWCIIDANRLANLYNQTMRGAAGGSLPDVSALPQDRGSIAGGIVLLVLGFLLFVNRMWDVSLEWLEDWWPLGMMILGGYLIWKARREKARRERA